ncbi:hypothetical protein D9M68_881010 [compost metagenome]
MVVGILNVPVLPTGISTLTLKIRVVASNVFVPFKTAPPAPVNVTNAGSIVTPDGT